MSDRRALLRTAQRSLSNCFAKFRLAQEVYLAERSDLYTDDQVRAVREHLRTLTTRYVFAQVHLEELWSESETHRFSIIDLIGSEVASHTWNDEDLLISMLSFESYLFQARSFVDHFMLYSCLVLGVAAPGTMSRRRFRKCMTAAPAPFSDRASELLKYFDSTVFGSNKWGAVLKGLRDRVAHRDIVRPRRQGGEEVVGVLLDWPTVQGLTLERLAQTFDNGAFGLLQDSVLILFERTWIAGPAREA
jgi:hypothetical protein